MLMKLVLLVVIMKLNKTVFADASGPSYSVEGPMCKHNNGCRQSMGESCLWVYKGCTVGNCMCIPTTQVWYDGQCKNKRGGRELCNAIDLCPQQMACMDGKCKCFSNKRMTDDGLFCLDPGERTLGDKCVQRNRCYHKTDSGYTFHDVYCDNRTQTCTCEQGFYQGDKSCLRRRAGEHGCLQSYHCQGGALCLGSVCQCPTGYGPVSDGIKCAKQTAIIDLPLGQPCDEINEQRYCAKGLVCHTCANERYPRCLQFQFADQRNLSSHSYQMYLDPLLLLVYMFNSLHNYL